MLSAGTDGLVHLGLIALLAEAGADLLTPACLNSPTLGDVHKNATCDALAQRDGIAVLHVRKGGDPVYLSSVRIIFNGNG